MRELAVYNLEFPAYITTLDIAGYKFKRIADYGAALAGLPHLIEVLGGEFPIKPTTGAHRQTAIVEVPNDEEDAILPWSSDGRYTRIQDVLLFLALFTGRNVFTLNPGEEQYPLRPDPRKHFWGGEFRLSAQRDIKWRHRTTGELRGEEDMQGSPVFDYNPLDLGLEKTIISVLRTLQDTAWRDEYGNGYFIFTFRQAIKQHEIEPAFLLCWSVWEHLFALHNRHWLDDTSIDHISGDKKIAFILHRYFLVEIDNIAREAIQGRITRARNRIIHFGPIPDNVDLEDMIMFIRLTDQLMALALRLEPSNALNSLNHLQRFLEGERLT